MFWAFVLACVVGLFLNMPVMAFIIFACGIVHMPFIMWMLFLVALFVHSDKK